MKHMPLGVFRKISLEIFALKHLAVHVNLLFDMRRIKQKNMVTK